MLQQNFDFLKKINHESGGSLFVGRRKTKRTLALRTPIHLVIKSERAKGKFSFVIISAKFQPSLIESHLNMVLISTKKP